ncbi:RNA methyltransferase [Desulfovibrio sp.]|uniref:TrmH family RNA methyltransferase n=1 Tax=Desulfovibrio sp. TaxID=885 RepID=UPI0025B8FC49|nr:RNA methyltransferase [Desulfovibrio sp.]MCI7567881.1 RNA methyltransferase [Desulfovibrio sp.]
MPSDASPTPLLPGLKPVLELLHDDPQRIDHVYCRKGLRSREAMEIQERCRHAGVRYTLVEQQALDRICREEGSADTAHQGVIARLCAADFQPLETLLSEAMRAPLPLLFALDQVQDPGNVGTLCRTLYALGGAGMIMPRHNSAYLGPAARRSAAGALERLPMARVTNLARALDEAEEAGFAIYGAGLKPDSTDVFSRPPALPAVIVLGSEEKGLRPGVAKRCSRMLHIPFARPFDSLNVAQAGGILAALAARAYRQQ